MDKYKETFTTWNKVAKIYQDKFMDLELYNDTYASFCKRLAPTASILELWCGPGNVTRHLLNYSPDFKVLATDMAPNMIELAKSNVPAAEFKILDARNLRGASENFDAILLGFCIPYLSKEDCEKWVIVSQF
jgi:ubiquinone/menaquinone biosynthesis C-methylase UbiE